MRVSHRGDRVASAESRNPVTDNPALRSQSEALDVELPARDSGRAQVGDDAVDHLRGAAHVDVALRDIGDEP